MRKLISLILGSFSFICSIALIVATFSKPIISTEQYLIAYLLGTFTTIMGFINLRNWWES